jgi:orotidine-5'-phosphate decarboxylase
MKAVETVRTPLIVGLDPRLENLPGSFGAANRLNLAGAANSVEEFCRTIIDIVAPLVAAVKLQAAFFEMLGPAGMQVLQRLVQHARARGLMVIMDAKRGDIGSTAEAYAAAFLGAESNAAWPCDAVTVNPYLGDDSLQPFVSRCMKTESGMYVLVRTSNPGGAMIQELRAAGRPIYDHVAEQVQSLAAATLGGRNYGLVGAVIGATNPRQLEELRWRMPNTLFLVPGLGAQGATAADVAGAFDDFGHGAVINSSRAIIFAHQRPEYSGMAWETSVERATIDTIGQIAACTRAGRMSRQ